MRNLLRHADMHAHLLVPLKNIIKLSDMGIVLFFNDQACGCGAEWEVIHLHIVAQISAFSIRRLKHELCTSTITRGELRWPAESPAAQQAQDHSTNITGGCMDHALGPMPD